MTPVRIQSVAGHRVFCIAAAVCGLLGALVLCTTPASAARPHEFSRTLGEHCLAEPCTKAGLFAPVAAAVNEATGELYVLDKGESPGAHGRVVRFSREGVLIAEFDGSGELAEGTAAGGGEPGEIPTGHFERPEAIAVDNSCVLRKLSESELTQKECEEQDPSNGDVYVVDKADPEGEGGVIDKYTADGKYVGQITEAGEIKLPNRAIRGVAVDPQGACGSTAKNRRRSTSSQTPCTTFSSRRRYRRRNSAASPRPAVSPWTRKATSTAPCSCRAPRRSPSGTTAAAR